MRWRSSARLHPLLLHFPIALVIVAAFAELVAIVTSDRRWHVVAVSNVRAAGVFAVAAALTGWLLASSSVVDDVRSLEWHRWIGTTAAVATIGAALGTAGIECQSRTVRWLYRTRCSGQRHSSASPGIWAQGWCGARTFCARKKEAM